MSRKMIYTLGFLILSESVLAMDPAVVAKPGAESLLLGTDTTQSPSAHTGSLVPDSPWLFHDPRQYSWDRVQYGPSAKLRQESVAERRVRRITEALGVELDHVKFDDTPFGEVVDEFLDGEHHLDVLVAWDALESSSAGVNRDTPVTLELYDTTVEEVLIAILDILSEQARTPDDEVAFYVFNGRARISTKSVFDQYILTRIYDITHLGMGTPYYMDAPEVGLNRGHGLFSAMDAYTPAYRQAGSHVDPRKNFEELRDQLIDILKNLRPETWRDYGGKGTISIYGNKLMIRQTAEMHELIGGKWW